MQSFMSQYNNILNKNKLIKESKHNFSKEEWKFVDQLDIDSESDVKVTNKQTKETVTLDPIGFALYEIIVGCQKLLNNKTTHSIKDIKAAYHMADDILRKYYSQQYFALFDDEDEESERG